MTDRPSTSTNASATNPAGQNASMSGTTGVRSAPGSDIYTPPTVKIDPCSTLGHTAGPGGC